MMHYYCLSICILLAIQLQGVDSFVFSKQWHFRLPFSNGMSLYQKEEVQKHTIYIGNLPTAFSESELRNVVSDKVQGVVGMSVQLYTFGERSFALLDFAENRLAYDAIGLLRSTPIADCAVDVTKMHNITTLSLVLPDGFNDPVELKNCIINLLGYDPLKFCRIFSRRSGANGAYLTFHTPEAAQRALTELAGRTLHGKPFHAHLSIEDPEHLIWLGNLDPRLTYRQVHQMLGEILGGVEQIRSMRLPIDKMKNGSRGFAFVEFQTLEQTERAMKELPNYKIYDRQLRVDSTKYSAVCVDPHRLVYMHNIDKREMTSVQVVQMVEHLMHAEGIVHSVDFGLDENKEGYCVVGFHSSSDRDRALKDLQNIKLLGKDVYTSGVCPGDARTFGRRSNLPRSRKYSSVSNNTDNAASAATAATSTVALASTIDKSQIIFVRGFPRLTQNFEIHRWLDVRLKGMPVLRCKRGLDSLNNRPLDYAHVYFYSVEDAKKAISLLHNAPMKGGVVSAVPAEEFNRSNQFYPLKIHNLALDWTHAELKGMLEHLLTSKNITYVRATLEVSTSTRTGESAGLAKVYFPSLRERTKAGNALLRIKVEDRELKVFNMMPMDSLDNVSEGVTPDSASTPTTATTTAVNNDMTAGSAAEDTVVVPSNGYDAPPLTAEDIATPPPPPTTSSDDDVSDDHEHEEDHFDPITSLTPDQERQQELEEVRLLSEGKEPDYHSDIGEDPAGHLPKYLMIGDTKIPLVFTPDGAYHDAADDATDAPASGGGGSSEVRVNGMLEQIKENLPFSAWPTEGGGDVTTTAAAFDSDVAAATTESGTISAESIANSPFSSVVASADDDDST